MKQLELNIESDWYSSLDSIEVNSVFALEIWLIVN